MKTEDRTMKEQNRAHSSRRDGVALIIVLGLLSVITLLAVAFSIAMRIERLAARNHLNAARAEHLIQVAFVRSTEGINEWFNKQAGIGEAAIYPSWEDDNGDPVESFNSKNTVTALDTRECTDLLAKWATNFIPHALLDDEDMDGEWDYIDSSCEWDYVVPESNDWPDGEPFGRVAFIAVNAGGFLDANYVGGDSTVWRTNVTELVLDQLSEIVDTNAFVEDRKEFIRFESLTELEALNSGIQPPISNLFFYSLDFDRDVYFKDKDTVGGQDAELYFKFNVNSITNFECYNDEEDLDKYKNDPDFDRDYWEPLKQVLNEAGMERPPDVAWNFVNWLDGDRVPQSKDQDPWAHTEGGEAIPLINEIVLEDLGGSAESGYRYEFKVELWFPFDGPSVYGQTDDVRVVPGDGFVLQIGVWTNSNDLGSYQRKHRNLEGESNPHYYYEFKINNMEYGTDDEFLVFTTENPDNGEEPINVSKEISDEALYFVTRVALKDPPGITDTYVPVEQASGPKRGREQYHPGKFDEAGAWSVDDPRSNGKNGDWKVAPKTLGPNDTEGAMNDTGVTDPWTFNGSDNRRQGHPIFAKDGLMRTIGEVGYIFRSNVKSGQPGRWDSIDLMHSGHGAYLLDHMTVRDIPLNPPTTTSQPITAGGPEQERLDKGKSSKGLVSINTTQREVLETLFRGVAVGYTADGYKEAPLNEDDIDIIVDAILDKQERGGYPFISFQDMFANTSGSALNQGGSVAAAFREAAENAWRRENGNQPDIDDTVKHDRVLEDAFRKVIDMITFRQNIFVIFCAAQALAPPEPGETIGAVVGERRAVATVYRDAYTGRTFTRSFRWLTEDDE